MLKIALILVIGILLSVVSAGSDTDTAKSHQARKHVESENHPKGRHLHHKSNEEDKHKSHKERYHHLLHRSPHAKPFKQRSSNHSICGSYCFDLPLFSVASIFNGSKELELIYSWLPKILPGAFGNSSANISSCIISTNSSTNDSSIDVTVEPTLPINSTNCTNSSIPTIGNPFLNLTGEYPIFFFLIQKFVGFISDNRGIQALLQENSLFALFYKKFVTIINFQNRTAILSQNLLTLFGYNGTFKGNLFDLNYTDGLISGFNANGAIKKIEQGISSLFNVSGLLNGDLTL
ncbi:uncharacterized protein LOC115878389 isoform X2 [Sitophilus oryzae]|uniref:Uncharacterized protein LOC115878389 isoform X2 n=1 Tax=Sitophilus oryzae TaxID=7048 RepID=A0A6J2XH36_SITOR|nr:uncharacterized protein LOC115878389 isoform X2 [Sitophilus oryzae]